MEGEAELRKLRDWFASGDAHALMLAYREHRITGTMGCRAGLEKSSVVDERGILLPETFEDYMSRLQPQVSASARSGRIIHLREAGENTLELLRDTLEDMIDSVEFGDRTERVSGKPLKELFARGHEMGGVLRDYMKATGQDRPAGRGGRS